MRPREPTEDEVFADNWGAGINSNYITDKEIVGRRFMPLPVRVPDVEGTFYEFKTSYRTGEVLTDILMRAIYGEHLNRVGDKRREIYYHLARRSSDEGLLGRLHNELKGLLAKLNGKCAELRQATNMVVPIPGYFNTFPTLG